MTAILEETGFPAKQLELEITESSLMENHDKSTALLNNLHWQGIRIAMDDFGAGYSSLAYLKPFSLDVLKIDISFNEDIPYNIDDMEIAATILAMGRTLGLKVLAEGVETPEQLAFLHEKGCDMYQGFIKSGPMPTKEFAQRSKPRVENGRETLPGGIFYLGSKGFKSCRKRLKAIKTTGKPSLPKIASPQLRSGSCNNRSQRHTLITLIVSLTSK